MRLGAKMIYLIDDTNSHRKKIRRGNEEKAMNGLKKLFKVMTMTVLVLSMVGNVVFAGAYDDPMNTRFYENISSKNNAPGPLSADIEVTGVEDEYEIGDTASISIAVTNNGNGDNRHNKNLDVLVALYDAAGNILATNPELNMNVIHATNLVPGGAALTLDYNYDLSGAVAGETIELEVIVYDYGLMGNRTTTPKQDGDSDWSHTEIAEKTIRLVVAEEETFTVSFDLDGGSGAGDYSDQDIVEGEKATRPENDPEKDGFTFDDWDFDFDTEVTGNVEVTALWTAVPVEEPVNLWVATDDGADVYIDGDFIDTYNSYSSATEDYVDNLSSSPFIAAKAWDRTGNANIAGFKLVLEYMDDTYESTDGTWWYYYDADGGVPAADGNTEWYEEGYRGEGWQQVTAFTLAQAPTPRNWAPDSDFPDDAKWIWSNNFNVGDGNPSSPSIDSPVYLRSMEPGSLPVYYTVTFVETQTQTPDETVVDTQDVLENTDATPVDAPEVTGKEFSHWSTADGGSEYDFDTDVTGDLKLFAVYTDITYTVEYLDSNDEVDETDEVAFGGTADSTVEAEVVNGRTFSHWSTSKDGAAYDFTTVLTGDLVLYPVYNWVDYTIKYVDIDGSEIAAYEYSAHYGDAVEDKEAPEVQGQLFINWYNGDIAWDFSTDRVEGDLTLRAHYEAVDYLVQFLDEDETTVIASEGANFGDEVDAPVDEPTKEGHTFAGWTLNGTVVDTFPVTVEGNTTFIASYTVNSYTVTFNSAGGSDIDPQDVEYNRTATEPENNPTRSGYTFGEWQLEGEAFDFDTLITDNITLTATWTSNGGGGNPGGGGTPSGGGTPTGGSTPSSPSEETIIDDEVPLGTIEFYEPYIKGYPDISFRPLRAITRVEMATIFARILKLDVENAPDAGFSDMSESHWGYKNINAIKDIGLINGYEDGTFKPDQAMTRAEIAAIIARYWEFTGFEADASETPLSDIDGHWAKDAINKIYNFGLNTGYEDGTFKPDTDLVREQVVFTVNNLIARPEYINPVHSFNDAPPTHWAYGDIEAATTYFERATGAFGEETVGNPFAE